MAQEKNWFRSGLQVVAVVYGAALLALVCNRLMILAGETAASRTTWAIFLVMAFAGVALTCVFMLIFLGTLGAQGDSAVSDLRRIMSSQKHSEAILTNINENLLLSDSIKSVAFRQKDRTVLQNAIHQDIRSEQWDSAELLIAELEKRFGYRQEAQQLRQEMHNYRNASVQEKISDSIKNIDSLWTIHRYDEAQNEVEILTTLYPDDQRVRDLQGQTERRRDQHKRELLDRWDKTVQKNDVEQGVEILKLLDSYLTPSEAAALEESARGVFRAKLHNMGLQFSIYVTEKKWHQALNIGQEIIAEYPNSRMAQEVRDKLEILTMRAK